MALDSLCNLSMPIVVSLYMGNVISFNAIGVLLMKKKAIAFSLIVFLISLVSCDNQAALAVKEQEFYYSYGFSDSLREYLDNLYDKRDSYSSLSGTYSEDDFRKATGYTLSLFPEIGTFNNLSSLSDIQIGISTFKEDDKASIIIDNRIKIVDKPYILENSIFLNAISPLLLIEFMMGDPVITANGKSYEVPDFPYSTSNRIINANWYNAEGTKTALTGDDDIYIIRGTNNEKEHAAFEFESPSRYFITKAVYYKDADITDTEYGFSWPVDGSLVLYPYKNIDNNTEENTDKAFDTIIFYVCMVDEDGSYHKKSIIMDFQS